MNIRLSTKEQEQLVIDNYKLVGYVVKNLKSLSIAEEDLVSVGTIGLIKAAIFFDKAKGIKFSTFAVNCIRNEICDYLKVEINYCLKTVSLDAPYKNDYDDNRNYYDMLYDINSNILMQVENRDLATRYVNIALNVLEPKNRSIILYRISGMSLNSISKIFGISKQNISRREKVAGEKIIVYLEESKKYNAIYNMEILDNLYTISFSSNNIQNFNKIFANFLQNCVSTDALIGLKVSYNRKLVALKMPAQLESFALIADIIREIDNYNLKIG